mmetsp:Transcript_2516/g.3506  ORF Transcript_2516/g.3506 Transcript_2516/m.3506 type:complete len:101 (+) Transcript_2516:1171-1473(+)
MKNLEDINCGDITGFEKFPSSFKLAPAKNSRTEQSGVMNLCRASFFRTLSRSCVNQGRREFSVFDKSKCFLVEFRIEYDEHMEARQFRMVIITVSSSAQK